MVNKIIICDKCGFQNEYPIPKDLIDPNNLIHSECINCDEVFAWMVPRI